MRKVYGKLRDKLTAEIWVSDKLKWVKLSQVKELNWVRSGASDDLVDDQGDEVMRWQMSDDLVDDQGDEVMRWQMSKLSVGFIGWRIWELNLPPHSQGCVLYQLSHARLVLTSS